ncbi:20523_t:CDS:2 [Entrophospora sp. SA101]|nr:20523_t:CDS:2 [Entrophospora sp. SA101]
MTFFIQKDSETAASAVRNLNNVEVGGRQLRVDYADNDPATSSNSSNNSSHSETAASAVRNLNNVEVGGRQLRVDYADNDPATSSNSSNNSSHQARALLAQNPQLCYALFQIMLDQNIVDPNILRLMQQSSLQGQTQPQPTAVQNTNPLVTPNYGSQPIPNTAQIPQQHQPNI